MTSHLRRLMRPVHQTRQLLGKPALRGAQCDCSAHVVPRLLGPHPRKPPAALGARGLLVGLTRLAKLLPNVFEDEPMLAARGGQLRFDLAVPHPAADRRLGHPQRPRQLSRGDQVRHVRTVTAAADGTPARC